MVRMHIVETETTETKTAMEMAFGRVKVRPVMTSLRDTDMAGARTTAPPTPLYDKRPNTTEERRL